MGKTFAVVGIPVPHDWTVSVPTGGGAVMSIPNPRPPKDMESLEWQLRYSNAPRASLVAAEVVATLDYLVSDEINVNEAIRRLRIMRRARRAVLDEHSN